MDFQGEWEKLHRDFSKDAGEIEREIQKETDRYNAKIDDLKRKLADKRKRLEREEKALEEKQKREERKKAA